MSNTYATVSDMKSSAGEERLLRMFGRNTSETHEEFFQQMVDAGAGIVDSYLGTVYTVPIETTGNDTLAALLRNAAVLCGLCSLGPGLTALPKGIKEACDDLKEWLQKIADGDLVLPGAPATVGQAFGVVRDTRYPGSDRALIPPDAFELNRVCW